MPQGDEHAKPQGKGHVLCYHGSSTAGKIRTCCPIYRALSTALESAFCTTAGSLLLHAGPQAVSQGCGSTRYCSSCPNTAPPPRAASHNQRLSGSRLGRRPSVRWLNMACRCGGTTAHAPLTGVGLGQPAAARSIPQGVVFLPCQIQGAEHSAATRGFITACHIGGTVANVQ